MKVCVGLRNEMSFWRKVAVAELLVAVPAKSYSGVAVPVSMMVAFASVSVTKAMLLSGLSVRPSLPFSAKEISLSSSGSRPGTAARCW